MYLPGNATVRRFVRQLTIAKSAVATVTVTELSFAIAGPAPGPALVVGSAVLVVPRVAQTNLQLGIGRVKDADEITIPITNPTAGALPAAADSVFTADIYIFTPTGSPE